MAAVIVFLPCAEGALELVDGKARVIKEELCDGAGFCMGVCPVGALKLEVRDADQFSEKAVEAMKITVPGAIYRRCANSAMPLKMMPTWCPSSIRVSQYGLVPIACRDLFMDNRLNKY